MQPALYLIPVTLGDTAIDRVLPQYNREIIAGIRHFAVENIRSARRFLRRSNPELVIDDLTFYTLDEHTRPEEISAFLAPLREGTPIGVISEAGCPAIADPGADLVAIAQHENLPVIPLVGPSSILLSLMASGFNGQNFAFNGYLPVESGERTHKIRQLEQRAYQENQTQIFIETPYRNHRLIEELVRMCRPNTRLCVACDLSCDTEEIHTRTMSQWSKAHYDLQKRPAIFLLYK